MWCNSSLLIRRLLNFSENILFALILIIPYTLINNKKIKSFYFNIVFVFFNIILFFETSYYYIFNVNISPSVIYVLLETNHIDFLDQVFIINPKTAFMSECDRELIKNDLIHIEMLCGKSFISSQKIISSIIDKINSHAAISAKKLRAECNTYDLKKLKHDIDNLTNVLGEKYNV